MLEALARACEDGGRLVGVSYSMFQGDPGEREWITGIALQFEHLTLVLRTVPDDDTFAVSIGTLAAEADETIVDASEAPPWPACICLGLCWGWRLTNQKGYVDGVRLEFTLPDYAPHAIVELIVGASEICVYSPVRLTP